ncbi:MAG: acylneuraminate cytidylyltransferase family protein [Anaerolineaceae bacterium]|nr:acylneuraminate cytidylyltransferase family protein [Anaerolineaceae bacterium]
MKIAAFVPMRHHSVRVVGKNYRLMDGKPLYHYIMESLLNVPEIDRVVVDTDSPVVIEGLAKDFPQVETLLRPENLRADDVPMNEILMYDTSQIKADYYLQTHCTNPLLKSGTISAAIRALAEKSYMYDSLFSVTEVKKRYWDQLARPINHNQKILLRTQDLPPIYEENSCIYIFSREVLEKNHTRIGDRPLMFPIPAREAQDIDDELEFLVTEMMMKALENNAH